MKEMDFFEELDRRTADQSWADFCQLDAESKEQFVRILVMNREKLKRINQNLAQVNQDLAQASIEMCFVAKKSMAKLIGMTAEEIETYLRKES
jgi:predicted transglutaminase-like cysteine proteinase